MSEHRIADVNQLPESKEHNHQLVVLSDPFEDEVDHFHHLPKGHFNDLNNFPKPEEHDEGECIITHPFHKGIEHVLFSSFWRLNDVLFPSTALPIQPLFQLLARN